MNHKMTNALFWILILISLIMFLWRVFGNSHTTDGIIYPLAIAMIVKVINMGEDINSIKIKFDHFEKRFDNIDKDFKNLSNEFRELKSH